MEFTFDNINDLLSKFETRFNYSTNLVDYERTVNVLWHVGIDSYRDSSTKYELAYKNNIYFIKLSYIRHEESVYSMDTGTFSYIIENLTIYSDKCPTKEEAYKSLINNLVKFVNDTYTDKAKLAIYKYLKMRSLT